MFFTHSFSLYFLFLHIVRLCIVCVYSQLLGKIMSICLQNEMSAPKESKFVNERPPQMSVSLERGPPLEGRLLNERPGRSFEEIQYLLGKR